MNNMNIRWLHDIKENVLNVNNFCFTKDVITKNNGINGQNEEEKKINDKFKSILSLYNDFIVLNTEEGFIRKNIWHHQIFHKNRIMYFEYQKNLFCLNRDFAVYKDAIILDKENLKIDKINDDIRIIEVLGNFYMKWIEENISYMKSMDGYGLFDYKDQFFSDLIESVDKGIEEYRRISPQNKKKLI